MAGSLASNKRFHGSISLQRYVITRRHQAEARAGITLRGQAPIKRVELPTPQGLAGNGSGLIAGVKESVAYPAPGRASSEYEARERWFSLSFVFLRLSFQRTYINGAAA